MARSVEMPDTTKVISSARIAGMTSQVKRAGILAMAELYQKNRM